MAKYNGHRSWNAWNVSLWINNDEGLYNMARTLVGFGPTKQRAAENMLWSLNNDFDTAKTPDGAPYTVTSIREAMVGID